MKKHTLLLLAIATVALAGCGGAGGGNVKYVDNPVLGKFPSVYVEFYKYKEAHKDDMANELQSNPLRTKEQAAAILEKYVNREKEMELKKQEMAAAELEKIIGREVPFAMAYDDPDFKIISATVENASIATGSMTINVKVEAKRDFTSREMNRELNYLLLNSKNEAIFKFIIKPFTYSTIESRPYSDFVADTKLCCAKGSALLVDCKRYDLTDFASILFVER